MSFFSWIRNSVKAAVLAGFQDAADEIQSIACEVEPVALRLENRPELEPAGRGNGRVTSGGKR